MSKINVLIDEASITKRLKELAEEINRDYAGKELLVLCVLKGSLYIVAELTKYLTMPVQIDCVSASSYGSGTTSSGKIDFKLAPSIPLEGKNVLVVEDIVDTGNTLSYLIEELSKMNPVSLKLCSLLNKPSRRVREVRIDYLGFEVPDMFVVGYGLDFDQRYRNLPYIGVVEEVDE